MTQVTGTGNDYGCCYLDLNWISINLSSWLFAKFVVRELAVNQPLYLNGLYNIINICV